MGAPASRSGARASHEAPAGLHHTASPPSAALVCAWCRTPKVERFHCGKRKQRCKCDHDYRTPIEKRRDAVLEKYGDDPAAYTPKVLAKLVKGGLFDLTAHFCPAGKLSMAEARAREAAQVIKGGEGEAA